MPVSRRSLLTSAVAISGVIPPSRVMAQEAPGTPSPATPIASPAAAGREPLTVDQVMPAYAERAAALAALGQEAIDRFLAGDDPALSALLAPAAAEVFASMPAASLIEQLETNRLSFSMPIVNATFDAHYTGAQDMEGFYTQGAPASFTLATAEPQSPEAPAGTWKGEIGGTLPIIVEFGGTAEDLTATLSVPDQGITAEPLSNVMLSSSRPIGGQQRERSLPIGGTGEHYAATHSWGEIALMFLVVPDAAGKVAAFTIVPQYPLPDDPAEAYDSDATYRLPFDGVWFTYWGGPTEFQNYHAATPSQRHAYDFVIWRDGSTFSGDGSRNADYHAWEQPALAPADGGIIAVENGMPDIKPGELPPAMDQGAAEGLHPAGNHVIIETAANEYVFVAHLREGSVEVREGDRVTAGDRIGLVGNSGNTSESHVHIHAQDSSDFFDPSAVGLPLRFSGYRANGTNVELGVPVQGQFIEP